MANKRAAVFTVDSAREIIRTVKRLNRAPKSVELEHTPRVINHAIDIFVTPTSTANAHVQIATVRNGDGVSVHEQQSVAVVWATGGTFTLTFDNTGSNPQTTAAIAWNASASAVKSALDALSNITSCTVTGTGTGTDPWIVTFDDAATNFAQMTATSSCTPAIIAGTRQQPEIGSSIGTWTTKELVFIQVPNGETPTVGTRYYATATGKILVGGVTYGVYTLTTVPSTTAFSGARVYNSGSQTITTGTLTDVTADSEDYDTDGYHSTSSNTERLTALVTGYYEVGYMLAWSSLGQPYDCQSHLVKSTGGTDICYANQPAAVQGAAHTGTNKIHMNVNDYVKIQVAHQKGSNESMSLYSFWIQKIG